MKKKALCLLLSLAMCLMLLPAATFAEDTQSGEHTHALCAGADECTNPSHSEGDHGEVNFATKLWMKDDGTLMKGDSVWNADGASFDKWYTLPSGSYYLGSDLKLEHKILAESGSVVLCLNGKTISMDEDCETITVGNKNGDAVSFTLADCKGGGSAYGRITHEAGQYSRGVFVYAGALFNMYGGSVADNTARNGSGGGICVGGSSSMYGGTIYGNSSGDGGGGVFINSTGTFNMYGGIIAKNNAATNGGGIGSNGTFNMAGGIIGGTGAADANTAKFGSGVSDWGTFTMTGGEIKGNTGASYGGGVFISSTGTFNMRGGSITDNTSAEGGGIYVNVSSDGTGVGVFNISGDVTVKGNTVNNNPDNVYLEKSYSGTVSAVINIAGALTCEYPIGVTTAITPKNEKPVTIATGASADVDYSNIIKSDNSDYEVAHNSSDATKLVLKTKNDPTPAAHTHFLCGTGTCTGGHTETAQTTFATPISGIEGLEDSGYLNTKKLSGGTYYLTGNIELGNNTLCIYDDVTLCLNGYSITSSNTYKAVINISRDAGNPSPKLTLCDCKRGGTVEYGKITNNSVDAGNSGVSVHDGGNFVMYGGEITQNTGRKAGGVYVEAGGIEPGYRAHFTMYGGKITNNTATTGGVYVGYNCEFNMCGGEITGNTGTENGGVYVEAGGGVGAENAVFKISGAAKITGNTAGGKKRNVYLPVGVTITFAGTLTGETPIGITANESPEDGNTVTIVTGVNGESDKEHFVSDDDTYGIEYDGGNLVLSSEHSLPDAEVSITAPAEKTYGDADFTVTASARNMGAADIWGWKSSDTNVLEIINLHGATATFKVKGAGSAEITAEYISQTTYGKKTVSVTVNKATVTVAAKNQSIFAGDTLPDLSNPVSGTHYTVTGLVGGDSLSGTVSMQYQKDGSSAVPDTSVAGVYDIVITGVSEPAGGNYKPIVINNGTLTIGTRTSSGGGSSAAYSVNVSGDIENGTVSVSHKSASKGRKVTVTAKPDSGYKLDKLTVTDKNGNALTLTDKGNGQYTFIMPVGKVEVKAEFISDAASDITPDVKPDETEKSPFGDVPDDAYYYEAVKWAAENGITDGVGNNLFAPGQPCTRAQIVTYLWRAAGSPEPKGSAAGMTDVPAGSYYEKAVAWAIESGITVGMTDTSFSPNTTCTRAQAVTFLARAAKAAASGRTDFADVAADAYYAEAVKWATDNGITNGMGNGMFAPDAECTRAQIVTFLWRMHR